MIKCLPTSVLATVITAVLAMTVVDAHAQYYRGGGYRASTAGEGYARGMADVVRSAGEANLMNSQAASEYEEARKKNLANRVTATEVYFERKRINREQRAAAKQQQRSLSASAHRSAPSGPIRLTASQVDPVTGAVKVPILLRLKVYAEHRAKIEALFKTRAVHGASTAEEYLQVVSISNAWQKEMRSHESEYPAKDFMEAMRFLVRLVNEAKLPVA